MDDAKAKLEQGRAERQKELEAIGAAFADVPLEELEARLARISAAGPQGANEELTRTLDQERAERQRILAALREPFHGVSAEEIEREAAKAIAEVRAERRARRGNAESG